MFHSKTDDGKQRTAVKAENGEAKSPFSLLSPHHFFALRHLFSPRHDTNYKIRDTRYLSRGFTLIEILITMAIMSMLATVGLSFFQNVMATYQRTDALLNLQTSGNYVAQFIEHRLRNAESVVAYANYQTCSTNCVSPWIIIAPKEPTGHCTIITYNTHDQAGEPDEWVQNGSLHVEDIFPCDNLYYTNFFPTYAGEVGVGTSPAYLLTEGELAQGSGGSVNVAAFSFVVSNPVTHPATVAFSMELRQSVTGTGNPPPANRRVSYPLSSTVNLR